MGLTRSVHAAAAVLLVHRSQCCEYPSPACPACESGPSFKVAWQGRRAWDLPLPHFPETTQALDFSDPVHLPRRIASLAQILRSSRRCAIRTMADHWSPPREPGRGARRLDRRNDQFDATREQPRISVPRPRSAPAQQAPRRGHARSPGVSRQGSDVNVSSSKGHESVHLIALAANPHSKLKNWTS